MFVQPNSIIKLYHNVPLTPTYEHSLYFASLSAQNSYFHGNLSILKQSFTAQSYQRVNRGSMKVAVKADDIYDCNYLAFQNTSFGNKWFYAFITSVEYISNDVSLVEYKIDSIQSYWFDLNRTACFVEREHSSTDVIGGNILPEPVEVGEYKYSNYKYLQQSNGTPYEFRYMIVVAYTDDTRGYFGGGDNNIYCGLGLRIFDIADSQGVFDFCQHTLDPDTVVAIYIADRDLWFRDRDIPEGGIDVQDDTIGAGMVELFGEQISIADTIDGYAPHNAKLYTYPYNFYQIDNANGETCSVRYEFCPLLQPSFLKYSTINPPCEIKVKPTYYKGITSSGSSRGMLMTEGISIQSLPQCGWYSDTFKAWLAQNSIPLVLQGVATAAIAGATGGTGLAVLAGAGELGYLTKTISQYYQASIAHNKVHGSLSSGSANLNLDVQSVRGGRVHCAYSYAKMIDQFFDKYGYQTNELKVPNVNVRPHWTYTKTVGCTFTGNMPADDLKTICEIFDKGITFWNNPSEVGNYSLDNSLIG